MTIVRQLKDRFFQSEPNRLVILLVLLVILPLVLLGFITLRTLWQDVQSSKQESAGAQLHAALYGTLIASEKLRGTYLLSSQDQNVTQQEILESHALLKASIAQVDKLETIAQQLKLGQDWQNIKQRLSAQFLSPSHPTKTTREKFLAQTSVAQILADMMDEVALRSNMLLDPEVESYETMSIMVKLLPNLTSQLGSWRAHISYGLAQQKTFGDFELQSLTKTISQLEMIERRYKNAFLRLHGINKIEAEQVEPEELERLKQQINTYKDIVENYSTPQAKEFFIEATGTIDVLKKAYKNYQQQFIQRVDVRANHKLHNMLFIALMLMMALISCLTFLLSNRKQYLAVSESSKQMKWAQEALQQSIQKELESANQINAIFNTVLDGLIVIDEMGIIQTVNQATSRIFGYSKEEMVGKNVKMLMPAEEKSHHDGYLKHYRETGEAKIIGKGREVIGCRKNGEHFPLALGISETMLQGKRMFVGTTHDVSEMKWAQEALQQSIQKELESANQINAIFNTVLDGLIVINEVGIIQSVNNSTSRIFGYSKEEMVGKNVKMLMPAEEKSHHDGYLKHYRETGEAKIIGKGREVIGCRKNGEHFPLALGISETMLQGKRMFVGTTCDVSDRQRMEKIYRLMSETVEGYSAIILDNEGKVNSWNEGAHTLKGYEANEILGQSFETFYSDEDKLAGLPHKLLTECLAKGHVHVEGFRVRKDGSQFYADVDINKLTDVDGSLLGFLKVTRDVSDRKKAEADLQQAYANLEEFTSVASHDLKSPLRGIADLTEWIKEDLGENVSETVRNNIDRVQLRIKRLETLVDDLLQYSRAGKVSENIETVDVNEMVNEILEIQPVPQQFTINVSGKVSAFKTTKTPLQTTLRNLISNAIKHHDLDHGHIDVIIKTSGSYCVFEISDDGPGIPQAAQERVFKLFQSLSKNKDSSGIGLAVSKRMVETYGGRIELESDSEKRGTLFRVWWPTFQLNKKSKEVENINKNQIHKTKVV